MAEDPIPEASSPGAEEQIGKKDQENVETQGTTSPNNQLEGREECKADQEIEQSSSPPYSFATDCLGSFKSVRHKVSVLVSPFDSK